VAGSAALGGLAAAPAEFPKREYKDGVKLSIIAYGGIVVMGMEQKEADAHVRAAYERGINYFDVAPSYGDGEAEIKLGPALAPWRKDVFLACKTTERSAAGAQKELEQSLKRMRTDHFDLYQFHAVTKPEEVDQILGRGGAAEVFVRAKKEGKVRFLGMSAHSTEAVLKLLDAFPLDSVLFPVNYASWAEGGFGPKILEKAKQKGAARMALKGMAKGPWPKGADRKAYPKCWYEPLDDPERARAALSWTLSQEITAAVPPGEVKLWTMAADIGSRFKPLTKAEQQAVLASAKGQAPLFPIGAA
jgi:aryl-alcohol dehydrogenase-like predicted oxidoreductase